MQEGANFFYVPPYFFCKFFVLLPGRVLQRDPISLSALSALAPQFLGASRILHSCRLVLRFLGGILRVDAICLAYLEYNRSE
jgi:hypothetical protein